MNATLDLPITTDLEDAPSPESWIEYVHFCSGLVTEVTSVTGTRMTEIEVILERGAGAPAVFRRRDVYFTSPVRDEQPYPF